jgi:hypothetical protein
MHDMLQHNDHLTVHEEDTNQHNSIEDYNKRLGRKMRRIKENKPLQTTIKTFKSTFSSFS